MALKMALKMTSILALFMLLIILPIVTSKSMYTQGLRITKDGLNIARNEQCYQLEFLIVITPDSARQLTPYDSSNINRVLADKLTQSMNNQLEIMEASRISLESYLNGNNGDFKKNGGQLAKMIGSGSANIKIIEVKEIGEYSNVVATACFTPKI